MAETIYKHRDSTSDDIAWIIEQEREIQEFRQAQLLRDGRAYDPILKKVVEVVE